MKKGGRPLLDYALHPRRVTLISLDFHTIRDDPSVDIDMAELLLANGAKPNQPVHLYDDETVWALFLMSTYEANQQNESGMVTFESLKTAWHASCKAMIRADAQCDCGAVFVRSHPELTTSTTLSGVFGTERAKDLEDQIKAVAMRREDSQPTNSCMMM
jgi:hypothetical protein